MRKIKLKILINLLLVSILTIGVIGCDDKKKALMKFRLN